MKTKYTITFDFMGFWWLALIMFVTFLTLKLTNVITWAWVWVFSPLWIAVQLYLTIFVVFILVAFVLNLLDRRNNI